MLFFVTHELLNLQLEYGAYNEGQNINHIHTQIP